MSCIKEENLLTELIKKKEKYSTRATTWLKGDIKNKFLSDCISRGGIPEGKMLRIILEAYYELPGLNAVSSYEIKKYIIDNVKFHE